MPVGASLTMRFQSHQTHSPTARYLVSTCIHVLVQRPEDILYLGPEISYQITDIRKE